MSYQNFIPTVWSNEIMTKLEENCIFTGLTNRKFEGDVKDQGDSVRLLGVGRPTIISTSDRNAVLPAPETISTTAETLNINRLSMFNFEIKDIDARVADGNLKAALSGETTKAISYEIDTYIASFATDRAAKIKNANPVQVTESNVLTMLDEAWQHLMENDVPPNEEINVVMTPRFWTILKQKYQSLDTNNSNIIKTGQMAKYSGMNLLMSNSIVKSNAGATDNIMVMTNKAISYVSAITHTEAYRRESGFADCLKGFVLYDAKITRPKELITLNVKYTS